MQRDLETAYPGTMIRIFGVNGAYNSGGNVYIPALGNIPWLQDPDDGVWTSWAVVYRDVVVLDEANRFVTAFNLTTHDLGVPAEYAALRQILVDAASD